MMFWARVVGGTISLAYLVAFLWTLRKQGSQHFMGRRGLFRLLSPLLGIAFGLTLAIRPLLAAWVFLVWVINGTVSSWTDYRHQQNDIRRRR